MVESVGRPHDFHSVVFQALCIDYLVLNYNISMYNERPRHILWTYVHVVLEW